MTTTPTEFPGSVHRSRIRRALTWLAELASRMVEPTECGWMIHCGGNGLIFVADASAVTRRCGCGGTWVVEETTPEFTAGTCWSCRRLVVGSVPQPASPERAAPRFSATMGDAE